nr:beta-xylosidase/alpha-L-arabinofuranosidase 1-like [Ipomoea batatas]
MARLNHFIILVIFFIFSSTTYARKLYSNPSSSSSNSSQIIRHACHPSRFSNLGLDMKRFGFCNKSLPYEVRVKDLVDRMTLAEKVRQLGDKAQGVERIGLPSYNWWSEALHGVSDIGDGATQFSEDGVPGATSFPMVITTAAAFNESLWRRIGEAVSSEARAMHNLGHAGLTYWSPNINPVRDPRWGRALETPGEDPFVVGKYAVNFVRGLQDVEGSSGNDTTDLNARPLKVAACCKHYAAYDVDNWKGVTREHFDSRVTEQDMLETFLKPFEMCVKDGDVASVMCSYNRVNGIPTCADPKLLKDTIRGEWDLHGYIVSDCDSIDVMVNDHKWLSDQPEDAVAQTLKAGKCLDLDCGEFYTNYTSGAVVQGKVREAEIDKALKNLYTVLMRLGFFDGSPKFEKLGKNDICSKENIELATEAAREGIVLLKNDNTALPLNPQNFKTLAVVGPHANATEVMIGNYKGVPCNYTSPVDGFSAYTKVDFQMGCADVICKNDSLIFPAMRAAEKADATVILAGLDLIVEAESLDREDLLLPGFQTQLINQVASAAKGPVILVLMSAGGLDISFAKDNNKIPAILWAGYPGEEGGRAIAEVIFGKFTPGGKLPLTWHNNSYVDALPMTSMPLRPLHQLGYPGRTYKFFNGDTVYPFGHGLSYTNFTYKITSPPTQLDVKLNKFQHCRNLNYTAAGASRNDACPALLIEDLNCTDSHRVKFGVEVTNVGKVSGSEVVMVYWVPPAKIAGAPLKQLIGFKKVMVGAGKTEKVEFLVDPCKSLGLVDYKAYNLLASGEHKIMLGDDDKPSFTLKLNFVRS